MASRKVQKLIYCDGIARHSETKTAAENSVRREIDELGKQVRVMDKERRRNLRRLSVTRKDLERSMVRYSQRMAEISAQRGLLQVPTGDASPHGNDTEEQRAKCKSLTALDRVGATNSRTGAATDPSCPRKGQLSGSFGDLRTVRKDRTTLPPPDIKITRSQEHLSHQERYYDSSDSESSVEIIPLFEALNVKNGQKSFVAGVQSCPTSPVLERRPRAHTIGTSDSRARVYISRSRSEGRSTPAGRRGKTEPPNKLPPSPQSLSPRLVRKRFRYSEAVESVLLADRSDADSDASFVPSGAVTVSGSIEYDPPAVEVEPIRPLLGRHSVQPNRVQKVKPPSPSRKHSADLKTLLTKRAFSRLRTGGSRTIKEI
ncbi:PREDICTED: uncharacterized protein LOC109471945 [Branchiostoma belcheri]|uniref:Uncharacterized protein LOC109471945 n=1 Tax=Branchiostoma belcheri TaxID=7741 RepID=A0A6P4YZB3_BRABE|nr:PREDICTED: uncharacterized protein LOC109471945 [Branchiostoma belcheri]XP_019627039.1 PREDICTED: uncharacterized protein LOC109471945 [Branchiostoma belcheri]XP_019627040.1 PREDICTED: uncharacterized protein LOC109471945 [Branchiostoma belcheri]